MERGAACRARDSRLHDRHARTPAIRGGLVMNGVHDMGGTHAVGDVEPEANEPPFHAEWEGRVLAMQRALAFTGAWNIDMSRAAQERLPAQVYLSVSYYHRWALGIEINAVEKGLVAAEARAAPRPLRP